MPVLYVYDDEGRKAAVLVPIADWEALQEKLNRLEATEPAGDETEYPLGSPAMKKRLVEAMDSRDAMPWNEVKDALGL